jgi:phosphatidylinositol alpha-1,6-mannosyltransferase
MLLLATQVFKTRGGIQSYMKRLLEIIERYCAEHGGRAVVSSLTDICDETDKRPELRFLFSGGNKLGYAARCLELCLRDKHFVIVGHISLAPVACALKCLGLITGYIVVLHGIEAWQRLSIFGRQSCRWADGIVSTTAYTARQFQIVNDFVIRNVFIIPLAAPSHTSVIGGGRPSSRPYTISTIGRIDSTERYKGQEELIRASAVLVGMGVDLRLNIIGTGDDLQRLKLCASEYGHASWANFCGLVSDQELDTLLGDSDVFCLPSKKEGFGIVFLEAMRFSLPCIGGNHGGTPEVIEDGQQGFLVEYGDVQTLVLRLLDLYRSPELAREMGVKARLRFDERYNTNLMLARWIKMLNWLQERA